MDPITGLNLAKTAADLMGKLYLVQREQTNREVKEKLDEVIDELRDLKKAADELEDQNRTLRNQNEDLQKKIHFHGSLSFKAPFYFQEGDATPFCPACWEAKTLAVHVTTIYSGQDGTRRDCPSCKQMYLIRNSNQSHYQIANSGPESWMG